MAKFMKVKCDCGNEQVTSETASTRVKCRVCGKPLIEPKGGKAIVVGGKIVAEME